jgi:uncharacterized protein YndB with AHSA1/START domain
MAAKIITPQIGKANTIKNLFSRETLIAIEINAEPSIIWNLLTNASGYPRWNTTVISIEGNIAMGKKIKLTSTLDPKRTFKLKVKEFQPEKRLVCGDAMGNRIYTINKIANDISRFAMTEKIGGPFFPLFAGMIPSFDKSFEQFVNDLKKKPKL